MARKKEEKIIEAEIVDNDSKIEDNKAYFFPRLVAYIIDIILVFLVCMGVMLFIPKDANYDDYVAEIEEIQDNYINSEITLDEYYNQSIEVSYDIAYCNFLSSLIEVFILILYFIVFQFYNKGQTLGKKIMKLRVVSINGELGIEQITVRSLIINSILVDILTMGALLLAGRNTYYYFYISFQLLAYIILFTTLMMILFRKDGRGLHDVITKTQVIQEK